MSPKASTALVIWRRSLASAIRILWSASGSSSTSVCSSDSVRATSPSVAPRHAKASAIERPSPRDAPVMSTRVPAPISTAATLKRRCRRDVEWSRPHQRGSGGGYDQPVSHDHATEGEEHYLETIFWLE